MRKAPLAHAAIAALVPHAGSMCLLDRALHWDENDIVCMAISHRDAANPLRRDGVLPAICGVEYALQAMALHGALTGTDGPQPPGYLASLRGIELGVSRLDDIEDDLRIEASALTQEARSFIYSFRALAGSRTLFAGQAAIILPQDGAA